MTTILLGMAGLDAFNADSQAQPPHRELAQIEQGVGRSEGHTVITADVGGQAALLEKPLKHGKSVIFSGGRKRFAREQKTTGMVSNGQRIAILTIAQQELAFVIGTPQFVGTLAQRQGRSLPRLAAETECRDAGEAAEHNVQHLQVRTRVEELVPADCDPVKDVGASSLSTYEAKDVSPEEAFAILDQIENPLVRCLVILLSATGLRPSEGLALRWSDIEWEQGTIQVRRGFVDGKIGDPKSLASRGKVEMHRALAAVLEEWRRQTTYASADDFIFASERKNGKQPRLGSMISTDYVRPAPIRAGVIATDCPRFGLHNCRHGLATFLTERGTDPKVIQRMLGWSDAKMLQRYAHPKKQARKAQGEFLGRMLRKGVGRVQKRVQQKRPSKRKGA